VIWVGTSGWQYASWKDRFYPKGLPKREWLRHYATRFPTVEVNNSFYRLPTESTFDRWRDQTPFGFIFVVKASRYITHVRRMREAQDSVDLFWSKASRLGEKLGPVLFQFPPNLKADVPLLLEFLSAVPNELRAAFEFREPSWSRDEVWEALDRHRAAWVLADRPGTKAETVVTGGWSYLRFHQGRRTHPGYTRAKLRAWADRIKEMGVGEAWIFFNNDPLAAAPNDALTLTDLLRRRGLDVAHRPHTVAV
jgi:uncharacterized protein YecE (DUF72 family)